MKLGWKKYLLYGSAIAVVGILAFILITTFRAKNTGFETKTLWDWMELLVIPFLLVVGAFLLNYSERSNERRIATDHQQEAALQSYLDRMADLLLRENLQTTKKKSVQNVASIRTLTVLRGLDGRRKGEVIRFLHEAVLINQLKPIIHLNGADLRGADLSNVNLRGAKLDATNLEGAILERINTLEILVNVTERSISVTDEKGNPQKKMDTATGTSLNRAILRNANLRRANLSGTDLWGADLRKADLKGATNFSKERQPNPAFLKGAIMPDGTKHD